MGLKIIITGASGMVGEGVLLECLDNPLVDKVLCIGRSSCNLTHPDLEEYIVEDFMKLREGDERLNGYDACFYCAGVSSLGYSEKDYTHITHDVTLHVAKVLHASNPRMVFTFVSGAATDSSKAGKMMWARVKGKTENALQEVGFKAAYSFRPGLMRPVKGQQNLRGYNKAARVLFPLFNLFLPGLKLEEMGRAMIHVVLKGYEKPVLEVKDIKAAAK